MCSQVRPLKPVGCSCNSLNGFGSLDPNALAGAWALAGVAAIAAILVLVARSIATAR